MTNFTDLILESFSQRENEICVSDETSSYTGKQCIEEIHRRKSNLDHPDSVTGHCILIQADRGITFWFDMLAVCSLGAVAVPIDSQLSEGALLQIFEETRAKICLSNKSGTLSPGKIVITDVGSDLDSAKTTVGTIRLEDGLYREHNNSSENKIGIVLFTSGTTGRPKGVPLSHFAIRNNMVETAKVIGLNSSNKLFVPIPYRFVSSLSHFLVSQYSKAHYIGVEEKLSQSNLVKGILSSKANSFGGSPLQVKWISEAADSLDGHLEWMMSSGGHLSAPVIQELMQNFKSAVKVVCAYGLTEVAGRLCVNIFDTPDSISNSVGYPIGNYNVHINANNIDQSDNTQAEPVGELVVESKHLFSGYIGKTANKVSDDGKVIFNTGDLAWIDTNGSINLIGRTDDIIKCSGLKVNLKVIESAVQQLDCFKDFAVVGLPEPNFGHIPCVAYTSNTDSKFNKGQTIRELKKTLPMNHVPRTFIQIESIPRTGTGKVQKSPLLNIIIEQST